MPEVMVDLPEDLVKELEKISKLDLSMVVSRLLKEKLARIARLEKIISKSKLSEEKAGKSRMKSTSLCQRSMTSCTEKFRSEFL
jgi:Cu/Ag efflux pump CusA